MLNLNQLRTFFEAARTLNFSMAARKLNVTQPAVTTQVKAFEEFCNLKLFRKKGGRVSLTDDGKIMLMRAVKLFEQEEELERTISDLRKLKQGHLRIGTTKTYARYLMPVLLTKFHKLNPGVIVDLDEGSSLEMTKSLLDRRNDFAIAAKVEEDQDIIFRPLLREEVVLIVSPHHHLSSAKLISVRQLVEEPIIIKELGSGTRKLLDNLALAERIELNIVMQTSNMEFIKELVKESKAVSFVVRSSVEPEIRNRELSIVPVQKGPFFMEIFLAHLREWEPSSTMSLFLKFLAPTLELTGRPEGAASLIQNFS